MAFYAETKYGYVIKKLFYRPWKGKLKQRNRAYAYELNVLIEHNNNTNANENPMI